MKKVYDRKKKEYITEEEYERRYSKRDKDICRGKRPHDFVLTLPLWVKSDERYERNPDPEAYYRAVEQLAEFQKGVSEELEAFSGIHLSPSYGLGRPIRRYVCAVCGKQEYKHEP